MSSSPSSNILGEKQVQSREKEECKKKKRFFFLSLLLALAKEK